MNWRERILQLVRAAGLPHAAAEDILDLDIPEGREDQVLAEVRARAAMTEVVVETPALLYRQAEIQPTSFNDTEGTFVCSYASELPIPRRNLMEPMIPGLSFGQRFLEILGLRPSEIDLEWFRSARSPFLKDHGGFPHRFPSIEDVLGVIVRPFFEGSGSERLAMAEVKLSPRDTEDMRSIRTDIAAGILPNVSAGYSVQQYRDVTPKPTDENPNPMVTLRAVRWRPREITLGAVTADITSHVRTEVERPTTRTVVLLSGSSESGSTRRESGMNWADRILQMVRTAGLNESFAQQIQSRNIQEGDVNAVRSAIQAEVARLRTAANQAAGSPSEGRPPADGGRETGSDGGRDSNRQGGSEGGPEPTRQGARQEGAATPPTGASPPPTPSGPSGATPPAGGTAAAPEGARSAEPADASAWRQAEVQRAQEIRTRVTTAGLESRFADTLIQEGVSADQAASRILDQLSGRSSDTRIHGQLTVTREALQVRDLIQNAFEHRIRCRDDQGNRVTLLDPARRYRRYDMMRMGEELLLARGVPQSQLDSMTQANLAARILGMHGTSDFPQIVIDAANKLLRQAYEVFPSQWRAFTEVVSARDFKTQHRTQLGEAPNLEPTNEHGEFRYGTLTDAEETYALETVGKAIAFTRRLLINDDQRALDRMPRLWANAAARHEADTVWGILTGNPAMGDGNNLFSAPHGNSFTQALDLPALTEARRLLRVQKGLDGQEHLNLAPVWIVGPPSLETTIDQLIAPVNQVTFASSGEPFVNPFSGGLRKIIEPRLEDASATAWYLVASLEQTDMIEAAFLEGEEGPVIETEESIDVDGMKMRVRHDFAAAAVEFRGLVFSDGTT